MICLLAQMARFEDQLPPAKMISPDSTSLYMAHIRLERFCASEHFHVGKFGLATRQIANLLRAFTQRVSGQVKGIVQNIKHRANWV